MKKVVLFGTGQVTQTVAEYIKRHAAFDIVGYTLDRAYMNQPEHDGKPVVAWEDLENKFPSSEVLLLGPISFRGVNQFRKERFEDGKRRGYSFASFIHPASHIYAGTIGENCVVLEANVIQPFVKIGNNVIVWSANHIGHHAELADHCFVTSEVAIGGNARIGERAFLGGGCIIRDNISVGEGCIVGLGACVDKSMPAGSVARPVSAEIIKDAATRFGKKLLG